MLISKTKISFPRTGPCGPVDGDRSMRTGPWGPVRGTVLGPVRHARIFPDSAIDGPVHEERSVGTGLLGDGPVHEDRPHGPVFMDRSVRGLARAYMYTRHGPLTRSHTAD